MNTFKQWLWMGGLLAAVIFGMHFYYAPKIEELKQTVIQLKLQNESDIIRRLDTIAKARRDSVWIIEKEVSHYVEDQKKQQNAIDSIHNVDSLIGVYYDEKSTFVFRSIEFGHSD